MKNMKKITFAIIMFCILFSLCSCRDTIERKPSGEEEVEIILYFPDKDGRYLHKEKRFEERGRGKMEKLILDELFDGPENDRLTDGVFGDVDVLSVNTEDGICTIDLSEEFLKHNTGGSTKEMFAIYSVVNSLCELDNVDQVKINIEGKTDAEFGGHFVLEDAFFDNQDIVFKEEW